MKKKKKRKTFNIHSETIRYSEGLLTISHLIKRLQTFGIITKLLCYIKESLIAGGNQAHTKKGDDTNE